MRLLVTNDDGVTAPGLEALMAAARQIGEPVCFAPVDGWSGCSHRVTTHDPIVVERHSDCSFAVRGTPADCVRVALVGLATPVDWVLSGINFGGNLGADVFHSGTVAAVREAVLHGRPGIALSHYHKRALSLDWNRAAAWAVPLLRDLMSRPWVPGTLWNINFPHLGPDDPEPEVVHCPLDISPLPVRFRRDGDRLHYDGNYHLRAREAGADVDVCFGGRIAVTRIALR